MMKGKEYKERLWQLLLEGKLLQHGTTWRRLLTVLGKVWGVPIVVYCLGRIASVSWAFLGSREKVVLLWVGFCLPEGVARRVSVPRPGSKIQTYKFWTEILFYTKTCFETSRRFQNQPTGPVLKGGGGNLRPVFTCVCVSFFGHFVAGALLVVLVTFYPVSMRSFWRLGFDHK